MRSTEVATWQMDSRGGYQKNLERIHEEKAVIQGGEVGRGARLEGWKSEKCRGQGVA